MGCAGLVSALALGSALTARAQLSWSIMTCVAAAAVLTFFVLAMGTKVITGTERLVYHHHELAVIAVATVVLKLANRPALPYLDVTILGVGAFLAWGRIGCLMAGCCHGKPYGWGICYGSSYAGTGFTPYYVGVRLFPLQALEAVFVFSTVAAGGILVWAGRPAGTALACYIVIYNLGRFLFEFWRGDGERPFWWVFSEAQWTSLVLLGAIAGLEWLGALPFYALAHRRGSVAHRGYALGRHLPPEECTVPYAAARPYAGVVRSRARAARSGGPHPAQIYFPRTTDFARADCQGWRHRRTLRALVQERLYDRHTAELLAEAISRLRSGSAPGELISSERGVFHVLIPSAPESGLRGGS